MEGRGEFTARVSHWENDGALIVVDPLRGERYLARRRPVLRLVK